MMIGKVVRISHGFSRQVLLCLHSQEVLLLAVT